MVVNKIIAHMREIGFSEYETRAYLALLGNNPATAYETARAAGIPTSKIYEVVAKLEERGVVSAIGGAGAKRYLPMSPAEFVESHRSRVESTLRTLHQELSEVGTEAEVSYIWNIGDYAYLMDKAGRIILDAAKTVLLSAWAVEARALEPFLMKAQKKKVRIAVVNFGLPIIETGRVYYHPIEDTLYAEKGGRGLVVVADGKEVLMGTIFADDRVEGAWSMNKGFVALAEDYIKHDVYIMKIVRRFDRMLLREFGERYAGLRDIFSDGGEQREEQ